MTEPCERASTLNPKIHSDSGYGSNKSNSQSQRSSGSSKSQHSSLSSGSGSGYPPHPNAPVSNADCQAHGSGSPSSSKRLAKKKSKLDRKLSSGEKNEIRTAQFQQEGHFKDQPMEFGGNLSYPSTPQPQSQMSPASRASSSYDSKALQVAALTHALSCMKKFQDPIAESEMNDESEDCVRPNKIHWQDYFSEEFKDSANEDNFAAVVSLDDGVVVYMTPTTGNILGFPKDMLLGRSFVDFVHPKHRMAFASHITCGINFPIGEQPQSMQGLQGGPSVKSDPFYCLLRQYRGLKTVGFGVTDKTVVYYPFKLTMQLKKVESPVNPKVGKSSDLMNNKTGFGSMKDATNASNELLSQSASNNGTPSVQSTVYLVIGATRIKSAYQYPEEVPKNPGKFITRHSASCHFGHMDAEAISYLGHLPQDMIGNSILDYYHPEDMNELKEVYESVMQEQGKPFRSKPYRFRVFNGTFAMLETDWSCFINPWSWKLEFVIGQHRVVQGPTNPNVFMEPKSEDLLHLPDEVVSDGRDMQDEIRKMLTETVTRRLSDPLRQQSSRRRKDLAALMKTLLEQMATTENSDKSGSQCSGFSVLERDSAMLGEISPHHDDNSGSNQSSSTPPSYNQLNYRENIERFFQSQPKTARSNESGEGSSKMDIQNRSSDSDSKGSPNIDYSSSSNIRNSSGTGSNESDNQRDRRGENSDNFGSGSLTQELLTRHNEDMEKYMMQRHRESRGKSSMAPGSHKEKRHKHSENIRYVYPLASSKSMDDSSDLLKYCRAQKLRKNLHKCDPSHGLKRTGNVSWDGDSHHAKQPHLDFHSTSNSVTASNSNMADPTNPVEFTTSNSINLWPPFSISMTPGTTTPSYRYTYPCYAFTNPSSAGHDGKGTVACVPGYQYNIDPNGIQNQASMMPIPTALSVNAATASVAPIATSPSTSQMNASNAGAPFYFLSGQQQFLPQQVQLMPAGVVYQPISPQMYGQHPQILMPMGTMIHPGQSIMMATQAHMAHMSGQTSNGVMPPTSINIINIPTPPVSLSDQRIGKSTSSSSAAGIPTMATSTTTKVTSCMTRPVVTLSGSTKQDGKSLMVGKEMSSSVFAAPALVQTSRGVDTSKRTEGLILSSSDSCGSGSDESMNASSINTKDSKESMDQCQSDQIMNWENVGSDKLKECQKSLKNVRNKQPPWLEKIAMTPDLAYRYTLPEKDLNDTLRRDLEALKIIGKQSPLVNDQLSVLYDDLMIDGPDSKYGPNLDDGISSSSGEDLPGPSTQKEPKKLKKKINPHQYNRMAITYEENAPFPPEDLWTKKVFRKPSMPPPRIGSSKPQVTNATTKVTS